VVATSHALRMVRADIALIDARLAALPAGAPVSSFCVMDSDTGRGCRTDGHRAGGGAPRGRRAERGYRRGP
jgi:hypothetical protein